MRVRKTIKSCAGLLLAFLLWLPAMEAGAHRTNLFAYVDRGQVYTESYFSDGQPVPHAQIVVTDAGGRELLAGETDAAGLFRFPLPQAQSLMILLKAPMGHRASYTLPLGEEER